MRMFRAAIAALAFALGGCAQQAQQLGMFTMQDAQAAAAIDPSNAACYEAFGALGSTLSGVKGVGVLTVVAAKIAFRRAAVDPACAPVEAMLLGDLLKLTPLAPLVP